MGNFEYQTNIHKSAQRKRKAHKAVSLVFAVGVLVIGAFGYFVWKTVAKSDGEVKGTAETSVYVGENQSVVQSDHFYFESSIEWDFIQKESEIPHKYVYRNMDKNLAKHEVTVYLNIVPQDLKVTYILPVTSPDGVDLVPDELSPKCSVPKGASLNPVVQTYKGISFICIPDRPEMIVAAGQSGNGTKIILTDLNDRSRIVGFFYRNLMANPDIEIFKELVRNFKLK